MSVLLIAEHNNKELKSFTLNAVTAASQIDSDVHALVIGNNCGDVAKAASELPLVKKVISVEAAHYENFFSRKFCSSGDKTCG
jgi:electron transfer flavoprotein alpha subunit